MTQKIQLLLKMKKGVHLGVLEAGLASEGQYAKERLPKGAFHRRGIHLIQDPTRAIPHSAESDASSESFDAVFEVGADETSWDGLIRPLKGLGERMDALIDTERSAVIAGKEHTIVSGNGFLLLVFALRRLPAMSPDAFYDYWLNVHADKGRAVPGLQGYGQLHGRSEETEKAAEASGLGISDFDGAAQAYYGSLGNFTETMNSPEVASDALEDEKKFIHHQRSVMGLYRIVWDRPV